MLAENCYIVSDDSNECMIVDCGAYSPEEKAYIENYVSTNALTPVIHILTHGHFDHVMGAKWIFDKYGLSPTICEMDADAYRNFHTDTKSFGFQFEQDQPAIGRCLNDGDIVSFGNHNFKAIHTPGHSKGGMVYYCPEENIAFTGDTLFRNSIGRTDLPGGNMFQIIQSLRKITQLPDDTIVYPGHGNQTTIGHELSTNPYLDR